MIDWRRVLDQAIPWTPDPMEKFELMMRSGADRVDHR